MKPQTVHIYMTMYFSRQPLKVRVRKSFVREVNRARAPKVDYLFEKFRA